MCRQEVPVSVYVVIEVWPGPCGPGVVSEQCCMAREQWRGPPHVCNWCGASLVKMLVFSKDPQCCMYISLTGCSLHCAV